MPFCRESYCTLLTSFLFAFCIIRELIVFMTKACVFLCVCVCVLCSSVVLWVGDLNYRLYNIDVELVKNLIAEKDFLTLHSHDQVRRPPPPDERLGSLGVYRAFYSLPLFLNSHKNV